MENTLYLPQRRGLVLPATPRTYEVKLDVLALWRRLREMGENVPSWDELLGIMRMALVVPQASASTMLQHIVNKLAATDPILKLNTNNITPGATDTASSYTEMTTQGYTAKTLTGASFTATSASPSHVDYAQQTFSFDGTGGSTSVYGYFWVKTTSGLLLLAERFSDGPYVIVNNGDQIKVTPILTGTS